MLAVGLIVTLQVATAGIRVNILEEIDQRRPVDITVGTWGLRASVPADLIGALQRVPGVDGGAALASADADFTRAGETFEDLVVLGYHPDAATVAAQGRRPRSPTTRSTSRTTPPAPRTASAPP